jgi:hypothetical protein
MDHGQQDPDQRVEREVRTCFAVTICWDIKLKQKGLDNFEVHYGAERYKGLVYESAAAKLGLCIMHALACEGLLDNREKRRIYGDKRRTK